MAEGNNGQQVKIKQTTKVRLDMMKGSKTYDQFIADMVGYFEQTGISPQSNMVSPAVAVKAQADRTIEVVRGVEKTQKTTLKLIYDTVNQILKNQSFANLPDGFNPDGYMPVEEVQDLLTEAGQLRTDNANQKEELNKLKTQLEISSRNPVGNQTSINSVAQKKIIEILTLLDEKKKISSFNSTIYEFDKSTFDQWMGRLMSDTKKL